MSALSDAFEANLKVLSDESKVVLYSCSAKDYAAYSKLCGYLDGLLAAQVAFDEAEEATT